MRKARLLAGAGAIALAAGLAGTAAASASTTPTRPPPSTGVTIVPGQNAGHTADLGLTQIKYLNGAGYVDTGTGFSKVSSSWTVPKVTCNPNISGYRWSVFWVGIDGFSNSTVEQDGTDAYCYGSQGPYYDTWWEHYPTNNIQEVGTSVKPGDKIHSSVVRSGTKYTVKVTDSTHTADSFTKTFSGSATSCEDTRAEWIAESPGGESGEPDNLYPLAKFAPWTNSSSAVSTTAKSGNIKTFPDDEIAAVETNDTTVKMQPSALNSAGTAFSVTWMNYGP